MHGTYLMRKRLSTNIDPSKFTTMSSTLLSIPRLKKIVRNYGFAKSRTSNKRTHNDKKMAVQRKLSHLILLELYVLFPSRNQYTISVNRVPGAPSVSKASIVRVLFSFKNCWAESILGTHIAGYFQSVYIGKRFAA